jgi:hypothetical protein
LRYLVKEGKGLGSAKILAFGKLVVTVPPIEVTHTISKAAGARVHFLYGWVELTVAGHISRAEDMREPAQGWDHVDKWIRDQAKNMQDCELGVDSEMIIASEDVPRAEYESLEAFELARHERSMVDEHFIFPRPPPKLRTRRKSHLSEVAEPEDGFFSLDNEGMI